jgi:hypothetical protein
MIDGWRLDPARGPRLSYRRGDCRVYRWDPLSCLVNIGTAFPGAGHREHLSWTCMRLGNGYWSAGDASGPMRGPAQSLMVEVRWVSSMFEWVGNVVWFSGTRGRSAIPDMGVQHGVGSRVNSGNNSMVFGKERECEDDNGPRKSDELESRRPHVIKSKGLQSVTPSMKGPYVSIPTRILPQGYRLYYIIDSTPSCVYG